MKATILCDKTIEEVKKLGNFELASKQLKACGISVLIKTDFSIGDEVWFIDGDNGYPHLYKGKVTNITITLEDGRPVVKYTLDGDDEPFYTEGELYASAEECVELYLADVQHILSDDLVKFGKPSLIP